MSMIQRGLNVAAVLLSLLTVGVLTDMGPQGSLRAQDSVCSTCSGSAPAEVVYTQPTPVYSAPVYSQSTTCGCNSCRKKVPSPQSDCQYCELDVKKGEVEKTCFKTEQKEVCIPAVRLPWKKCCPPKRSKVRTVNVLKKHKYKCPKCEYKWSVNEPEDFEAPEAAEEKEAAEKKESAQKKATEPKELDMTPEQMEGFDLAPGEKVISVFSDPSEALGDVPRPPVEAE